MIKIERAETMGWSGAIRGMRNALNSWDKADSEFGMSHLPGCVSLGSDDLKLAVKLAKAGASHSKYRRMIHVQADITAPIYWWKQFDTYKVGTVSNSTSTMHTLAKEPFKLTDFAVDQLMGPEGGLAQVVNVEGKPVLLSSKGVFGVILKHLNTVREKYLAEEDPELKKKYWWQMIQLLPSSYKQLRTVDFNYEVAAKIYSERKMHKLDEWHTFCKWLETLPYGKELICC